MSHATSYKQQKEDFVSNLSGGSVTEIGLVTSVAPASWAPSSRMRPAADLACSPRSPCCCGLSSRRGSPFSNQARP